eukprot:TRINITY_DN1236_c0_g1_i4.p2 TRINITY_DN1236_c0_g1~~TRINITY_DN1236_c0_g1_i4.p2  ORF type:complete len:114 (-),score=20.21 TRINITY_DN1236_c0_g1_i4:149-490(-)
MCIRDRYQRRVHGVGEISIKNIRGYNGYEGVYRKLNTKIILEMVKPFLETNNKIAKSTFKRIFKDFSQLDLIEIINILEQNCIVVDITESIIAQIIMTIRSMSSTQELSLIHI